MDTPADNLILRLLQEMRAEALARDEKTQAQIGTLADAVMRQTKRIDMLTETVDGLSTAQRTVAIAFDHQSMRLDRIEARLDRIEEHLVLNKPKH